MLATQIKPTTLNLEKISGSVIKTNKSINLTNQSILKVTKNIRKNDTERDKLLRQKSEYAKRQLESEDRKDKEAQLEASELPNVKPQQSKTTIQSGSSGGFFGRLLGFFGYLAAGWAIKYLPTLMVVGKDIMNRLSSLQLNIATFLYGALDSLKYFTKGVASVLGNVVTFNFGDIPKDVELATKGLSENITSMGEVIKDSLRLITTPLRTTPDTTTTESGGGEEETTPQSSPSQPPQGSGGKIIEYLTGDRISSKYRADHAAGNYHDHIAFDSQASRDAAIRWLQGRGWTIGSINTGRHAFGSYHYSNQAFDIPFYPNQSRKGVTDDAKGETKLSSKLRADLASGGFRGQTIGSGTANPPSQSNQTLPPVQPQQSLTGQPTPRGGTLSTAQLVSLAKQVGMTKQVNVSGYSGPLDVLMAAVAMQESRGKSTSMRSDTQVYGLWQIRWPVHAPNLRKIGITSPEQLYDPLTNAKAAKMIYDSSGITAWSAFTDGKYKQFLPAAQKAAGVAPGQFTTAQRQSQVPGAITPERQAVDIFIPETPISQQSMSMPSGGQSSPMIMPKVNEYTVLNRFIKNKLLLDLAYN